MVIWAVLGLVVGLWVVDQYVQQTGAVAAPAAAGQDILANIFTGAPVGMFSGGVGPLAQGMLVELQVYQSMSGWFGPIPDQTKPRTVTALLGASSGPDGCFSFAVITSDSPTFPIGTTGGTGQSSAAYPSACPPNVRRIIAAPSGGLIPVPIPSQ